MSLLPPGSDPQPLLPPNIPAPPARPPGAVPPPPGYVAYNPGGGGYPSTAALHNTDGLRTAAIILFWAVTASSALTAALLFLRRSVWDDFVADRSGFADLDRADALVTMSELLNTALLVAGGIVLSIWALRMVRNAELFGGKGLKPGLACGGWYIPIGNLWVPFVRLRAAAWSLRASTRRISQWQAAWVTMQLLSGFEATLFRLDQKTFDEIGGTLSAQATFSVVVLLVTALAALSGQRSLQSLDTAVKERRDETAPTAASGANRPPVTVPGTAPTQLP